MLQCQWPKVWSFESREAVRVAMETSIRNAMASSTNAHISGVVRVDLPHLGSTPPELLLSGIRELSLERTALMVKLRYAGDFSVTLRGLQINLDTISSGGGEADINLALPFDCPFEMTLHDIRLDGVASVELLQEVEECAGGRGGPSGGGPGLGGAGGGVGGVGGSSDDGGGAGGRLGSSASGGGGFFDRPIAAAAAGCCGQSVARGFGGRWGRRGGAAAARPGGDVGYGVLLGAGGRRAMRPPDAIVTDAELSGMTPCQSAPHSPARGGLDREQSRGFGLGGGGRAAQPDSLRGGGGPFAPPPQQTAARAAGPPGLGAGADGGHPCERYTFADLAAGRVRVRRRTLKLQLFGDPIKNLSVASNFASVPGANSKVEGTIKMLIKPMVERMMTDGITIHF